MGANENNTRHHRGRRKKKHKKKSLFADIILAAAVVVFCVAAFQLIRIAKGYLDGRSEYKEIASLAAESREDGSKFRVDFDELAKLNPDTVGWLRFHPKPTIINYPLVQGRDNQEYLNKTFTAKENTLGAIFLNADNSSDISDKNSVIYGHRMKDGSMFRRLWDYEEESFYKDNPYFYIYTPAGKAITYRIFAVSKVEETSDAYITSFGSEKQFEEVIQEIKGKSLYDTKTEVKGEDTIVTLSTCTAESDENRLIVCGVKEKETGLEE